MTYPSHKAATSKKVKAGTMHVCGKLHHERSITARHRMSALCCMWLLKCF